MSSSTEDEAVAPIEKLEGAFRTVLGPDFDEAIRSLIASNRWYKESLHISELFRLWVCDNVHSPGDPQWIFQPVRATERKFVAEQLGIERQQVVGRSPRDLADLMLNALGFPNATARGLNSLMSDWHQIAQWIERDEDEKAASSARVSAERLLRLLLYFYCHCGHESTLVSVLEEPGSLRVPAKLTSAVANDSVLSTIKEDGWADLGFLAIALRKFSNSLEMKSTRHISGDVMNVFSHSESEAFIALGRALQPYTHDRPSSHAGRRTDFQNAVARTITAIKAMIDRGVLPDQLVVIEVCESVTGRVFSGITEQKLVRHLGTALKPPTLGQRIWYVASTDRDLANCAWSPVPWP